MDFFFKRIKGEEKAPEMAAGDAVRAIADDVEKKLSPAYPQCEKICSNILKEVEEAKGATKVIIGSELNKEQQHYQIALQMQRNFAERVPLALNAVERPQRRDYDSFASFHSASLGMLSKMSQISRDNRYLPFFLDAEMGAFGKHMNEVIRLTGELGEVLKAGKPLKESVERARKLEVSIRVLSDEIKNLDKIKQELMAQNKELDAKLSSAAAKNAEIDREEGRIRKRIEELRVKSATDGKALTDILSLFQRQFRKMQKLVLDKGEAHALNSYINGPESMLISEFEKTGGYPLLKKILSDMKRELEKGGIEPDEKIRSRRLAAISEIVGGSLTGHVKNLIQSNKELADEETTLYETSRGRTNVSELQSAAEQNLEKIEKTEKKEAAAREETAKAISELESIYETVTGKKARILL